MEVGLRSPRHPTPQPAPLAPDRRRRRPRHPTLTRAGARATRRSSPRHPTSQPAPCGTRRRAAARSPRPATPTSASRAYAPGGPRHPTPSPAVRRSAPVDADIRAIPSWDPVHGDPMMGSPCTGSWQVAPCRSDFAAGATRRRSPVLRRPRPAMPACRATFAPSHWGRGKWHFAARATRRRSPCQATPTPAPPNADARATRRRACVRRCPRDPTEQPAAGRYRSFKLRKLRPAIAPRAAPDEPVPRAR